ncbi:hypothetical protein PT148_09130, partial [Erysipelothrix rhusiopathiae]|nr:hypothetical protein [Erysipelothrix rhusiopathiae]
VSVSCLMLSKSAKELVSTFQLNQQLKSERSNLKVLETKQGELLLKKQNFKILLMFKTMLEENTSCQSQKNKYLSYLKQNNMKK